MSFRHLFAAIIKKLPVICFASAFLVGCSGGGGGSAPTGSGGSGGTGGTASTSISGTAASGAAVSNGVGYALDATTGTQIPFVTSSTGSYSVDLAGKTGPFLIHVRGNTVGGSIVDLYSLASTTNLGATVNVTPLSDVVVGYAAGMIGNALERACTTNIAGCPALLNGIVAKLALSNSNIVSALPASILSTFAITPASFNAITSTFTATHTGIDGLLDVLQVLPPAAGATTGSYAINLNGATGATPLVTIPVNSSSTTTAPTSTGTVTATQLTQAANLATALNEVQAWAANYNTTYATVAPTQTQWQAMLDPSFVLNGQNATQFAANANQLFPAGTTLSLGSLAPYAGAPWPNLATAPAANVTYDANNCVTSLWNNSIGLGEMTFLMNKTITNSTGCVGTWLFAGNGSTYAFMMTPSHMQNVNLSGITYDYGINLMAVSTYSTNGPGAGGAVPTFALVTLTGPGLTTAGSSTATSGTVSFLAPAAVVSPNTIVTEITINDPYYTPYSSLSDCAVVSAAIASGATGATTSTPCYNANAIAGSDYVVQWFADSAGTVLLKTRTVHLSTTPGAGGVPVSWYPTITSITPSHSTAVPSGTSTVTVHWNLPLGSTTDGMDVFLFDGSGGQLAHTGSRFAPTATSGSTSITTASVPGSGWVTFSSSIGGYNVSSGKPF